MVPEKPDDKPQPDIRRYVDPDELRDMIESGLDADGRYEEVLKSLGQAATKNRL